MYAECDNTVDYTSFKLSIVKFFSKKCSKFYTSVLWNLFRVYERLGLFCKINCSVSIGTVPLVNNNIAAARIFLKPLELSSSQPHLRSVRSQLKCHVSQAIIITVDPGECLPSAYAYKPTLLSTPLRHRHRFSPPQVLPPTRSFPSFVCENSLSLCVIVKENVL